MALEVIAQERKKQGTGASRRLRNAGKVPGIVYGGKKPAQTIEIDHNALFHALRNEKFHASILDLTVDGVKEQVLLRAVNMHSFRMQVQHVDFQRVAADEKIHMKVPLHFVNAESSAAVKLGGAMVSRTNQDHVDLAAALSHQHTVYNYDRRGRGDSGDTAPWALEREIEDQVFELPTAPSKRRQALPLSF